ncbi:hypothetical protein A0H81_10530 [Grifola frondosa]|uniref:Uncharacterized protein n=1 Tax=Grifola frondosa TaxID=5627 RepID=A0A1C7LZS3_GRIFR|nr:hypothetical protein A0H81_10530 [Grifola frondosa]
MNPVRLTPGLGKIFRPEADDGSVLTIAEIIEHFDFSNVDFTDINKADYLKAPLAPSFGNLDSATISQLDNTVKVMIASVNKALGGIPIQEMGYDKVIHMFSQHPLAEPIPTSPDVVKDEFYPLIPDAPHTPRKRAVGSDEVQHQPEGSTTYVQRKASQERAKSIPNDARGETDPSESIMRGRRDEGADDGASCAHEWHVKRHSKPTVQGAMRAFKIENHTQQVTYGKTSAGEPKSATCGFGIMSYAISKLQSPFAPRLPAMPLPSRVNAWFSKGVLDQEVNADIKKPVMDICVICYPESTRPYFYIFRIQLIAWRNITNPRKIGLILIFNQRRFKPRETVISGMTPITKDKAIVGHILRMLYNFSMLNTLIFQAAAERIQDYQSTISLIDVEPEELTSSQCPNMTCPDH